jgi:prephenate dehydratase
MLSASAVRLGECAQLPTWVVTSASVGVATVAAAAGMAATSASIAPDAAANLYRLEALQRDMPRYCARHDFHSFSQHG